jgi:hypothetical protein
MTVPLGFKSWRNANYITSAGKEPKQETALLRQALKAEGVIQ